MQAQYYSTHSAGPPQLVGGLVGGFVAVLLSCCPAVLLRCFLVGFLWFCLTMPLLVFCCCLVRFLLSCCVAALYTLKGDRDREGGWNTGLTIIPPSHQLTTPRLPTTLIHPTHHKYQEILKKKQAKMKRWHQKHGQKTMQIRQKMAPEEPGCTKSAAKIEKNALNRPKWLPDGSQDPLTQKDS